MTMTRGVRKFALTAHLAFSVGWIGAVIAYLTLVVAAMTSQDAQTVPAAWIAMALTGWYAIDRSDSTITIKYERSDLF